MEPTNLHDLIIVGVIISIIMAGNIPKIAILVGGGATVFVSGVTMYRYFRAANEDLSVTERDVSQGVSYVTNPERNHRFQEVADFYDNEIGREESVMGMNLLRRSLLYFHAKGNVLEVGAGTGRNIDYYPSNVERIVLTDSSANMLFRAFEKVRGLSEKKRSRYACLQADASHLRFPDHSFDTVVDTFGLCSYDDPVQVLKEMARVCKPDGKILLLEHGRSKVWHSITHYLDKNAERHAKNWGCVWNRDLDAILEEAGLQVERLDNWHFGTTYYVVARPRP